MQKPPFKHGWEAHTSNVPQNGPLYPCRQLHTAWLFAFTIQLPPFKQVTLAHGLTLKGLNVDSKKAKEKNVKIKLKLTCSTIWSEVVLQTVASVRVSVNHTSSSIQTRVWAAWVVSSAELATVALWTCAYCLVISVYCASSAIQTWIWTTWVKSSAELAAVALWTCTNWLVISIQRAGAPILTWIVWARIYCIYI